MTDDTEITSYRQDADQLHAALAALIDAYFYGKDAVLLPPVNKAQALASFNAGKALGAHMRFVRSKKPQEV